MVEFGRVLLALRPTKVRGQDAGAKMQRLRGGRFVR